VVFEDGRLLAWKVMEGRFAGAQAERWRSAGSRFINEYHALWQGNYLHPLGAIRELMEDDGLYGGGW
jgi:hypothetical protein